MVFFTIMQGTGTWILEAARTWKVLIYFLSLNCIADAVWSLQSCHFVGKSFHFSSPANGLLIFLGLDIVPLHPNLQDFASFDLTSRVTWVQHNLYVPVEYGILEM